MSGDPSGLPAAAPGREGGSPLLGIVLTGGRSRRYGAPKGEVPVGGVPMARRAADALAAVVRRIGAVGDRPVPGAPLPLRGDPPGVAGPLAGVLVGLEWAAAEGLEGVLVLACDLPLVDPPVLEALAAARGGDAVAVVPREGERAHATCAVWELAALDAVRVAAAGGDPSLRGLLAGLDVRWLDAGHLAVLSATREPFLNVNTRGQRRKAEALLGRTSGRVRKRPPRL